MPESSRKPTTLLVFLGLAVVWGSSFLFIKVGLQGLSAPQVVFGRVGFGALTLVAVMLLSRRRWPRERWISMRSMSMMALFTMIPSREIMPSMGMNPNGALVAMYSLNQAAHGVSKRIQDAEPSVCTSPNRMMHLMGFQSGACR